MPGVSSLTAVPEYAGIDLIHAGGVQFASVTDGRFTKAAAAPWGSASTVVVSTVVSMIGSLVDAARAAGRSGDDHVLGHPARRQHRAAHPADHAGRAASRWCRSTKTPAADPAHVIMGVAAEQRSELSWYETKPLFGWRVLVPRTKDQAAPMVARLRTYGAHSEEVPTISVEPPRSPLQMDKAIRGLVEGRYEWVAFTSVNAVKAVREKFEEYGLDARAFSGLKVAVVGEVTAKALQALGYRAGPGPGRRAVRGRPGGGVPAVRRGPRPDQPGVPAAGRHRHRDAGRRADQPRLGGRGRHRLSHRPRRPAGRDAVREAIKTGKFDAVVFTSSSTVRNLVGIAGKPHPSTVIAVIGPATAKTCEEHGLRVDVIAAKPSVVDLADALASFAADRRDALIAEGEPVLKPSQRKPTTRKRV